MSQRVSSDDAASSTRAQSGPPPSTRTSQRRHVASREHEKIEWAFGWIFTDVTSDQCPAKIRSGRVRSVENKRQVRSAPPVANSGMRACTASLIELRHEASAPDAPRYRGEVEFLSQADWDKELVDLL